MRLPISHLSPTRGANRHIGSTPLGDTLQILPHHQPKAKYRHEPFLLKIQKESQGPAVKGCTRARQERGWCQRCQSRTDESTCGGGGGREGWSSHIQEYLSHHFTSPSLTVPLEDADDPINPDRTQELHDKSGQNTAGENRSDLYSTVSAAAKLLLRTVRDSADAFPPLKSVAGGICSILDNYEVWFTPETLLEPQCLRSS